MPLAQTITGLQIQSLGEIKAELEVAHADPATGWGADVVVRPNSAFGQIIGIFSIREALIQQNLQVIQSEFDPALSSGVRLDVIASYTGTERRDDTVSASGSGLIQGTPGTNIPNLRQVRNTGTSDLWEIIGGPYVIGFLGDVQCSIQATETGPKTFTGSTVWSIETPVAGWDDFFTSSDIDPEETGRNDEADELLRERRKVELFAGGNDLDGIKAQVSKVLGVLEVAVFENRDCGNTSPEGIPPGAFEVMVEGGADADIAEAIRSRKPPGAESFGAILTNVVDTEGNPFTVGHTRPTDVDINIFIFVTGTVNAEGALPDNVAQLLEDAALDFGNDNTGISQDVVPSSFCGVLWAVLLDPISGKYAAENIIVQADLNPPVIPTISKIPIDIRSRADYDSARIFVTIT